MTNDKTVGDTNIGTERIEGRLSRLQGISGRRKR
nr:MAG TPA: hypothetical protein [Caudoviricetes sp.]